MNPEINNLISQIIDHNVSEPPQIVLKDTETGPKPQDLDCEIDDVELIPMKMHLCKNGMTPSQIIENFRTKYKGRYTFA